MGLLFVCAREATGLCHPHDVCVCVVLFFLSFFFNLRLSRRQRCRGPLTVVFAVSHVLLPHVVEGRVVSNQMLRRRNVKRHPAGP